MIGARRRRFWKAVTLVAGPGGWQVMLDARVLKTPGKIVLILPSEALAQAVAGEWRAVAERAEPEAMPLTRLANSAAEKIAPDPGAMVAGLAAYAENDLLCYRAEAPARLRTREDQAWDPMLDWAADFYGIRPRVFTGVLPGDQEPEVTTRLTAVLAGCGPFTLSALGVLVPVTGSLILGLAMLERRITADEGFALSRIDEDWQEGEWGRDAEAASAAEARRQALQDAVTFLDLLPGPAT